MLFSTYFQNEICSYINIYLLNKKINFNEDFFDIVYSESATTPTQKSAFAWQSEQQWNFNERPVNEDLYLHNRINYYS